MPFTSQFLAPHTPGERRVDIINPNLQAGKSDPARRSEVPQATQQVLEGWLPLLCSDH